jgi:hypothetical protein
MSASAPKAPTVLVTARPCAIARSSPSSDDVFQLLARAIAPCVAAELQRDEVGQGLVDLAKVVPAPKRLLYAAARRGEFPGAALVGRRWIAPRASIDAWLRARGPRAVQTAPEVDELEPLRRQLAAGLHATRALR